MSKNLLTVSICQVSKVWQRFNSMSVHDIKDNFTVEQTNQKAVIFVDAVLELKVHDISYLVLI